MSMANLVIKDLADGQEEILPCGVRTIAIAPKADGSTFDFIYSNGAGSYGIKVPYNYDYPQVLRSPSANPLKIVAHGSVHLIYST